MAILYKKITLLVARFYSHGGEGLERGGLNFFRDKEQYDEVCKRYSYNETKKTKSFGTSWLTQPETIEANVEIRALHKFLKGESLSNQNVFICIDQVDKLHAIGGL